MASATFSALAATAVLAASAQAAPSFSLEPVDAPTAKQYFVFDSKPGATVSGRIRVINTGNQAGAVKLYAVDATTGQTSGAVYLSNRDRKRGVGRWVRLEQRTLSLAPGKSRVVGFTARVPAGTGAGEHLGGIVAENATLQRGKEVRRNRGRFRINVRNLTVMAVQLNLPGRRARDMSIGRVRPGGSQGGHQAVLVGLANKGNVMLKPRLSVRIEKGGKRVQRFAQKLDTFVADTDIDYPMPVRGRALGRGKYKAFIELSFAGRAIKAVREFEISPKELKQVFGEDSPIAQDDGGSFMKYLPWILLALVGIGAGVRYLRNRGREPGPPATAATPGPGPTANGMGQADLARLLAEVDQVAAIWFLRQIADGTLARGEASAQEILAQARGHADQDALNGWSYSLVAASERAGVSRPFKELRIDGQDVVYRMDREVAEAVRRLVDETGRTSTPR